MNLMSYDFNSYFSKVLIHCVADDTGWLPYSTCNQNTNIDLHRAGRCFLVQQMEDHITWKDEASGVSSGDMKNIVVQGRSNHPESRGLLCTR